MRTIILGAGIAGVTAAYYLASRGDEVVLIDRGPEPASETSHANAGLIAIGHAHAWAEPKAPWTLIKSIFESEPALRFRFQADADFWRWCLIFLRNCTRARNDRNTSRKLRLCLYSAGLLKEIADALKFDFDERRLGALYLHREQEKFEQAKIGARHMQAHGLAAEFIDPDRCVELEPALAATKHLLAGAIHGTDDFHGDCRRFSKGLTDYCRETLGVETLFDAEIKGFDHADGRVMAVRTAKGPVVGDRYVLSLGSWSPRMVKPLGLYLPVIPVKGYSVTVPIAGHNGAPERAGVDEHNLIGYARLGDTLRYTAYAEFTGYDAGFKPSDFTAMTRAFRMLYPDAADYDRPTHWACLRPMTPQGPPILGPAGTMADNLWLNTGHGHMGWSMACGAAKILADMMHGEDPAIPTDGMMLRGR